jgi:hypothetical protein
VRRSVLFSASGVERTRSYLLQEATGSMKGQTGLQRVMRFLGFSSDLAVEQRLDNLQPYFSIESGKHIQESPRQASESLRRRDDRVFGSRSITWCDNCSGRVVMLRQRAELKQAALIGRPVAPIALSPVESQILFCDLLLSHANIAMAFIPLVLRDAVLSRRGNTFERPGTDVRKNNITEYVSC